MNRSRGAAEKKPYQPPKLVVYGDLTEMTKAAGSMSNHLDGATMGNRKTA